MDGLLAQTSFWNDAVFYAMAALACASAVGVVVSRNIVRMAVCLLFTLTGVAGLYFVLDAEFIAAAQLVIYVGGTLILIVFGVMLTSKLPSTRLKARPIEIIVALAIGGVMLIALLVGLLAARDHFVSKPTPDQGYPMAQLGQELLGNYLVPFEIVSVLLLAVMIGAAYLAKARRHGDDKRP